MLILHSPDTLLHDTVELLGSKIKPALESPARIRDILDKVSQSSHTLQPVDSPLQNESETRALLRLIEQSHDDGYVQHLKDVFQQWRSANLIEDHDSILPECFRIATRTQPNPNAPPKDIFARPGYYAFDMSSGIMSQTYRSTLASAHLAAQATQQLLSGGGTDVLALCRPPGHHCDGRRAGGYCYVNNAAVAISTWRTRHPDARIGVLDLDFHHGNGTQEIYYSDPRVLYASIHGEDEFPYYTGRADETGTGAGEGMNLNLPLETGSPFAEYLRKLEVALIALEGFELGLLVVSLGFDTFHLDPLGNFKIETDDYRVLARRVRERLVGVPAVILLEGGYVVEHLGLNLLSFLEGWEGS